MKTKIKLEGAMMLTLSLFLLSSCFKKSETIHPVKKDLTQAVYASGKLFPKNHYTLLSKFAGYVQKINVVAGEKVKIGDALITIRNESNDYNISSAKNILQLAIQNADENGTMLSAIRKDVESVRKKYDLDSVNFARYTSLQKENATSKVLFDNAETQFEISKKSFLKAEENYENTKQRLKVEAMNAKNQLDALLSNKNDFVISSVINGKVYDIVPKVNDLVGPGSMLMELGDSSNYEVELSVDETDISFIRIDEEVAFSIDAYRDKIFKGKIKEIYQRVNSGNKTARVMAEFESGENFIAYSGMSVEANIIVAEKKNVLIIPKDFLKDGNLVKVKGEDKMRTIVKGAEDLQFVEIISGIDENTELVKP